MYISEAAGAMCGSYAISQAVNDTLTASMELCAGVPFGAASMGDDYGYSRMLTVYRDFNLSIDDIAYLFGIELKRMDFEDNSEFTKFLMSYLLNSIYDKKDKKIKNNNNARLVCGPLNMSFLKYLPLSQQYRGADHYIALFKIDDSLFISDSEGAALIKVTADELSRMFSIKDIPEACGKITVREILSYSKDKILSNEIIAHTIRRAAENFRAAENSGQGSGAFREIINIVKYVNPVKWSAALYIDIGNYIQRKIMISEFFENIKFGCLSAYYNLQLNQFNSLTAHLKKSVLDAAHIRRMLRDRKYNTIPELLLKLSESEKITASLIINMEDRNL